MFSCVLIIVENDRWAINRMRFLSPAVIQQLGRLKMKKIVFFALLVLGSFGSSVASVDTCMSCYWYLGWPYCVVNESHWTQEVTDCETRINLENGVVWCRETANLTCMDGNSGVPVY